MLVTLSAQTKVVTWDLKSSMAPGGYWQAFLEHFLCSGNEDKEAM